MVFISGLVGCADVDMTVVPSSNRRHDAKTLFYFAIDVSDDSCFDVAADFGGPPNVQEPPKTMVRPSGRAAAEYSS